LLLLLLRLGHIVEEGGKPLELAVCHGSRAGWKGGGGVEGVSGKGVDVVGVAWGRQGCVQTRAPECLVPFLCFIGLLNVFCKEEGVNALFALRAPASSARQEEQEQRLAEFYERDVQCRKKGKEGNLPQEAPREWLK